ncbi:MAG: ATP-binding cassette domain-containing protein [Anaerolineaceae bacterium]|nr:ATP-binding cassette domain-containing protein [Anaerolineaceae bacterium]
MPTFDIFTENVSKTYRARWGITIEKNKSGKRPAKLALDNVSLLIGPGETVGLIGLNGSGKSTLVKILCGIIKPDQGEVNCLGYNPFRQRREYVNKIGVVFGQKSLLYMDLPLKDSLELYRVVYDISRDEFNREIENLDNCFGINEFIEQPVRKLSFGQRVRGDLAASILHNPQLVFLDEPSIGLDILACDKLSQYINRRSENGKTTILVSHNVDLLSSSCSRLIVLEGGVKRIDRAVEWLKLQSLVDIEFAFNNVRDAKLLDLLFTENKCKERGELFSVLSVRSDSVEATVDRLQKACSLVYLQVKPADIRDMVSTLILGNGSMSGESK